MAARTLLLALLLAASVQPVAAKEWNPTGDAAVTCYVKLLALSGYGRFKFERAAFLVEEEDGSLSCKPWPATFQYERIDYKGVVPKTAVAVIHTHPHGLEDPSNADRAAATRLRMPFVVVTPTALSVVGADGATRRVATGVRWWKKLKP